MSLLKLKEENNTFAERLALQQMMQAERIVAYFGSQALAASELNLTRQSICQWLKNGKVSKKGAILAENYDPKYFKKEHIRPDVKSW